MVRLANPGPLFHVGELSVASVCAFIVGLVGCALSGDFRPRARGFLALALGGPPLLAGLGVLAGLAVYRPTQLLERAGIVAALMAVGGCVAVRLLVPPKKEIPDVAKQRVRTDRERSVRARRERPGILCTRDAQRRSARGRSTRALADIGMQYPDDTDGQVLRQVASNGADMTQPMLIEYTVAAPSLQVAQSLAERIAVLGYEPRLYVDDEDHSVSLLCARTMLATHEGVVGCQGELNALCRPSGAECDGWLTAGNRQEH